VALPFPWGARRGMRFNQESTLRRLTGLVSGPSSSAAGCGTSVPLELFSQL